MPTACLSLYMRAGMEEAEAVDALVQRLKSDGYQAETVRYNFSTLLSEAVVNINSDLILKDMDTFLPRVEQYERGEFWTYSHESNFVRLLVILQRGGIYIDSDLIVTKPFAGDFQNSVCHEMPLGMDGGEKFFYPIFCPFFTQGEKVNNNVLIFEPGHPFLIEYLHQMLISYDPKLYHANGPNLITKVYQIEKWFIPIIHKVFEGLPDGRAQCLQLHCASRHNFPAGPPQFHAGNVQVAINLFECLAILSLIAAISTILQKPPPSS